MGLGQVNVTKTQNGNNLDADSGSMDCQNLLSLRNVDAFYNKHQALFEISFCVKRGEVLAVTGLNGAGKTTLTRVISGLISPRSGSICFKNKNITGMRIEKIKSMGLDLIPDRAAVFNSLSVLDNLKILFYSSSKKRPINQLIDEAFQTFPRLSERINYPAGQLSGGEQRMLSLTKALVDPPEFLIVDELSLGLAPKILDEIWEKVSEIKDNGTTMLLVEQYSKDIKRVATCELHLVNGRIVE